MTNSLLITKYILKILSEDRDLTTYIPFSHIYPLEAKQGTKFPFAAIERTGISSNQCKDGRYEDYVNIRINIADNNYENVIHIANEIRNWLEGHRYKDDQINIRQIKLSNAVEDWYNDAFIQSLDFEINIQSV